MPWRLARHCPRRHIRNCFAFEPVCRSAERSVRYSSDLEKLLGGPLKTEAVPGLIDLLSRRDSITAIGALHRSLDVRAVEVLIKCLGSRSTDPRDDRRLYIAEASAKALGYIRDKRAVPSLIATLQNSNSELVVEAALALGNIGDRRAVEPLISRFWPLPAVVNDQHWVMCRACVEALGRLGDRRASDAVLAVLVRHRGGDTLAMIEACKAAALLGETRALPVIEQIIQSEKNSIFRGLEGAAEEARTTLARLP